MTDPEILNNHNLYLVGMSYYVGGATEIYLSHW